MRSSILVFSIIIGAAFFAAAYPLTAGWAYATRSNADQNARDREVARDDRVQVWEVTLPTRANAARTVAWSLAAGLSLAMVGTGAAWAMFTTGKARAATAQAMIAARCIRLDPQTRQYPLVLDNPTSPRFVFNPNTGAVTRLATAQEYAPQLAANAVQVQIGGVGQYKLDQLGLLQSGKE